MLVLNKQSTSHTSAPMHIAVEEGQILNYSE